MVGNRERSELLQFAHAPIEIVVRLECEQHFTRVATQCAGAGPSLRLPSSTTSEPDIVGVAASKGTAGELDHFQEGSTSPVMRVDVEPRLLILKSPALNDFFA
jgi:hypothetical protein